MEVDSILNTAKTLANADDAWPAKPKPWKVLVVDDDESIHTVTHLCLDGYEYDGTPVELMNAYSGEEAKEMIKANPDIAVVLLDVVMETNDAGLQVVDYVRNELENRYIRIILRTGQPGEAPEPDIITKYDINDYKDKTELTRNKLCTSVYTSLACYKDLIALEDSRKGLEKLVGSITGIFQSNSIEDFAQGVLEQLTALLSLQPDAVLLHAPVVEGSTECGEFEIVAGTGRYDGRFGKAAKEVLEPDLLELVEASRHGQQTCSGEDYYLHHQRTAGGDERVLYVSSNRPITARDKFLLYLYAQNVAVAHEHVLCVTRH